jgi:hypothetical protein
MPGRLALGMSRGLLGIGARLGPSGCSKMRVLIPSCFEMASFARLLSIKGSMESIQ